MIWIVLPAYNEVNSLPALVERMRVMFAESNLHGEVILVNDGSTDGTLEIAGSFASSFALRVINLQPNRGLATALKAGLESALEKAQADDTIVTMDADNSHPPSLIPAMVRLIDSGSDVVIASRYRTGSRVTGVPRLRRVMSLGASALFRLLLPIPGVRDYTCGFRAYRAGLLMQAFTLYSGSLIQQKGFGCTSELLMKLRRLDPRISEIPLTLNYNLSNRVSKMKVWRTVKETLGMIGRHTLRREL